MQTEYKLSLKWRLFYGILFGIYLTIVIYLLYSLIIGVDLNQIQRFCSIPFLVIAGILWSAKWFHRAFWEKIIVYPKEIQYQALGYTTNINWLGLKRTGKSRQGAFVLDGIFVPYSPENIKIWLPGVFFKNGDFIPLSMFSDNWRDSELGQQIKQYAPHLFEKE
jgi:hypothetical protein